MTAPYYYSTTTNYSKYFCSKPWTKLCCKSEQGLIRIEAARYKEVHKENLLQSEFILRLKWWFNFQHNDLKQTRRHQRSFGTSRWAALIAASGTTHPYSKVTRYRCTNITLHQWTFQWFGDIWRELKSTACSASLLCVQVQGEATMCYQWLLVCLGGADRVHYHVTLCSPTFPSKLWTNVIPHRDQSLNFHVYWLTGLECFFPSLTQDLNLSNARRIWIGKKTERDQSANTQSCTFPTHPVDNQVISLW